MGSDGSGAKHTSVSAVFDAAIALQSEQRFEEQKKEFERLLRRTNRLIRWYRSETRQAAVVELTRAQASPPSFTEVDSGLPWGIPLSIESDPPLLPINSNITTVAEAVRKGLAGPADPEVASLFLLDAEQARRDGRFRETVLFCWSAIDSTFSQKYITLVGSVIDDKNERESFINFRNASMRYRMSAGLHFFAGISLYDQSNNLWTNLTSSYSKRNKIIHEGASAQEADAELALHVAREVVRLLDSLKPKKPKR